MNDRELLRVPDVADIMGLTPGRIYQLISEGRLPVVRMGRSIWIPRQAWNEWLKEQTDQALGRTKETPARTTSTSDPRP